MNARRWDPFREFEREVGRLFGSLESMNVRAARPFPAINLYDALPDRVNGAEVTAEFAQGILTVTLPKVEEARPRQIAVKAAG
jgi:HSP20 family protein